MHKFIATCLLLVLTAPAAAEDCPPSYRFVDFGSEGPDGVIRRGGTIFRAFLPDGTRLLNAEGSVCLSVEEVARDGRALPIPVVSRIEVDPEVAALDLLTLHLSAIDDITSAAEESERPHRETLALPETGMWRGDTFLCASPPDAPAISCQVLSPYPGAVAPVVYCNGQTCEVPAMVSDGQIVVRATWPQATTDPTTLGAEIMSRLQMIRDFLEEQT